MDRQGRNRIGRWLGPLGAAALAAALTLPGLGSAGLLDPWEMKRVAVARAMIAPQQVLVASDEAAGTALQRALGASATVRTLAGGVGSLRSELGQRSAHAVVVDGTALGLGERVAMFDARVGDLDALRAAHPAVPALIVTDKDATWVRWQLARARARGWARSLQRSVAAWLLPPADRHDEFAGLFVGEEAVAAPDAVASWVQAHALSPWLTPLHRHEGRDAPAPLLDAWLVAASLSAFGATETAARLPGTLLLVVMAATLFVALRRSAGGGAAWAGALVLATLPMAVGSARVVTLEASAALGLLWATLGVAGLGARDDDGEASDLPAAGGGLRLLAPLALLLAGMAILLLGRGLGGLTMAAAVAVGAAAVRGRGRAQWLGAALAAGTLAVAAKVVLGDDDSALLRALRFTRVPFEGGVTVVDRDFATVIGQVGFGLHPWGGLFVLGGGWLLLGGDGSAGQQRLVRQGQVWALGAGAGLLATMALLPHFHHVVAPIAPLAAALAAVGVVEIARGRLRGPLLALLVVLAALLLHRETGKDASTLVRSLAWDPGFGGEKAPYPWPEELLAPRAARALGLLGVLVAALALAQPLASVRRLLAALQGAGATAWALAGLGVLWLLDALVSLGMRLDVLLRAEAARLDYPYDRMWVTIVSTRPEVIAGGVLAIGAMLGAWVAGLGPDHRARRALRWLRPLARRGVATAGIAAAALGALVAGLIVHTSVLKAGIGAALVAGLAHPLSWMAVLIAGGTAGWAAWARRQAVAGPARSAALGWGALALAGVGLGAAAAAGTWSYGVLAACWGGAAAAALAAAAAGSGGAGCVGAWARLALGAALWTGGSLLVVFGERLLATAVDGRGALLRTLLTAPDALALLALAVALTCNHAALRWPRLAGWRHLGLWALELAQKPALAVLALAIGGVGLAGGVAFGLLPEMSVHFSQKHLLAAIRDAGGDPTASDPPVAFKHAGAAGAAVLGSNFYTAALPTIAGRDELLRAIGGERFKLSVSDWGTSQRSAEVELGEATRFAIVPKAEFSALNAAWRARDGVQAGLPVLDASSSRLVLLASKLPSGKRSANWLDDLVLDDAALAKVTGLTRMSAMFEDSLELVGWRLREASVRRGQKYHLELFWKVHKAVATSNMLFMHPHPLHRDLWPAAIVPHTEAEGKRCTGCFQTNHWRVGDIVRVDIDQEVPLGNATGPAEIILGWFDPQTDKRLTIGEVTGAGTVRHNDNRVTIGHLQVR